MAQETRHDTTQSFESWRSDESVVSLLQAVAVALHSVVRDSSKFTLASSNLL